MRRSGRGKEEQLEDWAASDEGIPQGRLVLEGKTPAGLSWAGCRGDLLTLQDDMSRPEPEPR